MKLTNKQQKDLETVIYFIPEIMKHIKIEDKDIMKFFEYSDQGKHKQEVESMPTQGIFTWFGALIQGKRWRGIHMEQYEQGILDGSTTYFVLLGWATKKRKWYQFWKDKFYNDPIPRSVVDFMKKEMFKGHDADLIERVYCNL
mgnify:CR=1 FL=1